MSNLRQSKTDEEWNRLKPKAEDTFIRFFGTCDSADPKANINIISGNPSIPARTKVWQSKRKTIYKHSKFESRTICIAAIINTMQLDKSPISRTINIGYSIKNPLDKNDKQLAEKIALGRAENKPIGSISTNKVMLLNVEIIDVIMKKVIDDIKQNPSKYIAGYKGK